MSDDKKLDISMSEEFSSSFSEFNKYLMIALESMNDTNKGVLVNQQAIVSLSNSISMISAAIDALNDRLMAVESRLSNNEIQSVSEDDTLLN